ncbi:MAG: hypothetical protein GX768_09475 [Chloroflexi bacterium]|nr:hypothetical protein [Chloroflexota bacterium]
MKGDSMKPNYGLLSLNGDIGGNWEKIEATEQVEFNNINNEKAVDTMENNQMQIFSNELFGNVRTLIGDNGEALFCANDVARALGYADPARAIRQHCGGGVKRPLIDSLGREQEMSFLSESNVYRLIMRSTNEKAIEFEKWVMEEVIPSIRKHGAYMTPQAVAQALKDPAHMLTILHLLNDEQQEHLATKQRLSAAEMHMQEIQPKVQFAELVEDMEGSLPMETFSKVLQKQGIPMGRNKLFAWLRSRGYLMADNQPYQRYTETHFRSGAVIRSNKLVHYTQITGKGMMSVAKKLFEEKGLFLADPKGFMAEIQQQIKANGAA